MFQYFKFLADLIHVHIVFSVAAELSIFSVNSGATGFAATVGHLLCPHSSELLRTARNFAFAHSASNPFYVSYLEL